MSFDNECVVGKKEVCIISGDECYSSKRKLISCSKAAVDLEKERWEILGVHSPNWPVILSGAQWVYRFPIATVKFSVLKQHGFIILQLWGWEVWNQFPGARIGVLAGLVLPAGSGENRFPCLFPLLEAACAPTSFPPPPPLLCLLLWPSYLPPGGPSGLHWTHLGSLGRSLLKILNTVTLAI